jgi:hypothetical protein
MFTLVRKYITYFNINKQESNVIALLFVYNFIYLITC